MVSKILKSAIAMTLISGTLAATPAMARYGDRYDNRYPVRYDDGYYNQGYDNRGYDNRGYGDGYRCKKSGTGGLIVGAVAGGLLGRAVVNRRGDKTTGAIIGAGVGALAGRAIDRNGSNRC